ncbi:cytochrome ubiquinol oxidase subunit I [Sulfoacidibacillus thermotolerans]|uniref:Cytochrome ubiquinol oxidase subunit I n=1 Tax=Sulfoacidibacillus thermotolerans TaxID=1765684 RepID=A0A2U3DAQ9_SULT2|nr:cytochrome ubiquinol oxidase subunit I [Sulfoacidibacillus thermotolerans]PWI58367.1 cytochrome ubiquinol oxidase subunit I [Sulfoacidibacillus thermotolerans]
MEQLIFARLQFGETTVFHFLFVPLTIGLAFLLAVMETIYVRTGDETYRKMLKFWGKLFLINFAIGVVTGIMQEFQFGMNWSNYSRFVGDVFGAPLAIEALLAFFMESTFLGVWMFGWDRVSKRVHLMSIWLVSIGTAISAFWILTANSFMQEPVGYTIRNGHAEMSNFLALLGNTQLWLEFPHTLMGAFVTGSFFVLGVSAYHLLKKNYVDLFKKSFQVGIIVATISSVLVVAIGHAQAQHLVTAQPMKMAASEALWNTSPEHAPWTIVAGINTAEHKDTFKIQVPYVLSILAYDSLSGKVEGMNQIQAQYVQKYGPGNYIPPVPVTFWSFRIMVLAGTIMMLLALFGAYLMLRKKELLHHPKFLKWLVWAIPLPFIANTTGWLMTEIGRQPWIVFGLQKTAQAVSPTVSAGEVLTTMIGFALIYGVFGVVEVYLLVKNVRLGPDEHVHSDESVNESVPSLF